MDIMLLAETLRQFLAPALPFLLKAVDKASEEAGNEITAATLEKAKDAWGKLGPAVEARPAALEAAQDAAEATEALNS